MSAERLVYIVEKAAQKRLNRASINQAICGLDSLQYNLPDGIPINPCDEVFRVNGTFLKDIPAYCDFDGDTVLEMREYIWDDLFHAHITSNKKQEADEVVHHELGHLWLEDHKRKVIARARKSGFGSSKRAAKDHSLGEFTKFSIKHRNADLEEEADYFGWAMQVPVSYLDGRLSIKQIAEKYFVSNRVAYLSAMMAKDYHRALALIKHKNSTG